MTSIIDPFHLSVLAAVRDWLKQNGISAEVDYHKRVNKNDDAFIYVFISAQYKVYGNSWNGNIAVKNGEILMADELPLPLALPDSLDILVNRIKSRVNKDREIRMG